jgi:diaminopimelate epimerase
MPVVDATRVLRSDDALAARAGGAARRRVAIATSPTQIESATSSTGAAATAAAGTGTTAAGASLIGALLYW